MGLLKNRAPSEFCQIPNALIVDNRLSMGSKVLYCYLRSKPDQWKIYNKEVAKSLNISEDTLSKYWKELLQCGWISRQQNRDKNNSFSGGYDYEILYRPDMPESEKGGLGKNPVDGKKLEHINNEKTSNTEIKSTNVDLLYIANKPKKQVFTKPTLDEIKAYCQQKGITIDCEYFFDYYESNGWKVSNSPMKDWQATVRNWARRNTNWNTKETRKGMDFSKGDGSRFANIKYQVIGEDK